MSKPAPANKSAKKALNSRPSFFKRQYWVLPNFQRNFILQMLLNATLVMGIFYYAEIYILSDWLSIPQKLCQEGSLELCRQSEVLKDRIEILFFCKTAFIFIALGFWGLFFSHRVAGPVYRLRNALNNLAEGKRMEKVVIRKDDYLLEIADSINKVIEKQNASKE